MRAHNASGDGAPSAVVSATPYGLPSAPTLTATAGKGQVTLKWTAGYDGEAAIDRFEYRYSTDLLLNGRGDTETWKAIPDSAEDGANETSFTVTGLTRRGKVHLFQIRAHNLMGDGAESAKVSAAPFGVPLAPTLTATPGDGEVTLRWVPGGDHVQRGDGGKAITDWKLRQSTDGALDTETWTAIPGSGPTGANATSFTVPGLTRGTAHLFQVRAVNSVGDGDPSAEVSATPFDVPLAPTLTATPGAGKVTLSWVSGGDGGSAITGWEPRLGFDSTQDPETSWLHYSVAPSVTSITLRLHPGAEHFFQLWAHNSAGKGAPSLVVSATPGPRPPPAMQANRAGQPPNDSASANRTPEFTLAASETDGAVTLTWDAPADGGAPSGYTILRRAPELGERALRTLTDDTGSTSTIYTDASVQPGVKYIYRVKALTSAGQGARSRPAQIITAAPGAGQRDTPANPVVEQPGQPGNLAAAESEAAGAVTLTWDAPADDGAPSGYMILRRAPGLGQRDLRTLTDDTGSAATTHTDTSVQPGVKYIYRVKARNAAGQGALSRPAQITTAAAAANNPPEFGSETHTFPVSESATAGDMVGSVAATDSDAGDELSYTITAGNETGKFAIGSADGQVTVAGALDYETAASYTLTVQASDGNGGRDTATVTITVTDVNEAPVFNPGSYTFAIAESANTWTSIGRLTATDQDAGDTITHHITSGNADDRFMIDWTYGDILLTKELDYETTPSYTLTVEARDGNGGTATASVVITVTKANGSPTANESPTFDTAGYAFTIPEDTATGGSVGAVSASDPDEGQSVAYSTSAGNDAGRFSINAGTGEVAVASALDYETASSYTLTVQASDGNGGTDTATVVITVTKVNNPPEFGSGTYTFPVSESATAGDMVGSVAATDSDAGDELSYTITAGNEAGKFAVGSADGQVTVAGALDHETAASYTLTVQARDGNGGTATAAATITVTDANEAPVFNPSSYAFSIPEDTATGGSVGAVSASDPDEGQSVAYSITAGNDAGKFSINAGTGEAAVASALDYETASSYTLTVQARDGNGGTEPQRSPSQ